MWSRLPAFAQRLKDLISFLNRNSSFDIFGVELEFYKYENYEITIPKLFGAEVKKEVNSTSSSYRRRRWDEETFFSELAKNLEEKEVIQIRDLYGFFVEQADHINWGTGIQRGSFNPIFNKLGPRSLLSIYTDGTLMLNYSWMTGHEHYSHIKQRYLELLSEFLTLPSDGGILKIPAYPFKDWGKSIQQIKDLFLYLLKTELS